MPAASVELSITITKIQVFLVRPDKRSGAKRSERDTLRSVQLRIVDIYIYIIYIYYIYIYIVRAIRANFVLITRKEGGA